jgi:predicted short-subunit dehydrogenase-like oxidoreductase (DUF2520 family)
MRKTLSIFGAGRVGRSLGRGLGELGWKIGPVVTRSEASSRRAVRFIGQGQPAITADSSFFDSALLLITTPDDRLPEAAAELQRLGGDRLNQKVALHTSGALDGSVLGALRARGAFVGSLHPLQSFSGVAVPELKGRIFAIEGDPAAVRVARQIVRAFKASPLELPADRKILYHAAASMVAGQSLVLQEAATQLLMSLNLDRRRATRGLLPLTRQVLDNFERLGPRAAWTGPLSRRDFGVIAAHFAALAEMPAEFAAAYQSLNLLAARLFDPRPEPLLATLNGIFTAQNASHSGAIRNEP